ncbi:hypothetical protein [Stetteria hydrogenophila]
MSEAIRGDVEATLGLQAAQASPQDVEELASVVAGFTGVAAVVGGRVADELVLVAWEALGELTAIAGLGRWTEQAARVAGESAPDALELVKCLGADALEAAAEWAFKTLAGLHASEAPGEVEALASCAGWSVEPASLPPLTAAAAVAVTLNAAFNKYLALRGLVDL